MVMNDEKNVDIYVVVYTIFGETGEALRSPSGGLYSRWFSSVFG